MNKISDTLINAGHQVVQFSPIVDSSAKPGKTKAEVINVGPLPELEARMQHLHATMMADQWTQGDGSPTDMMEMFKAMMNCTISTCRYVLHGTDVVEKLKKYNFDVGMAEPFDYCGFGLFHVLGIEHKFLTLSTHLAESVAQWIGVPTAPSYVPGMMAKFGDEMTLFERFQNTFSILIGNYMFNSIITPFDELFVEKYGGDFPGILSVVKKTPFVLTNSEPLVQFPHPTSYRIVDIGGISIPPSGKALEKKWDQVLSLRSHTVLVSFGSVAKSVNMPEHYRQSIIEAMHKFKDVTFIWKFEREEGCPGVLLKNAINSTENIVNSPWVPQTDLLSDHRLTGFMTHGGAGSVMETTYRGKPVITVPLFGDQFRNAKMVDRLGTGIPFDKFSLSNSHKIEEVFRQLISNKSLQQRAQSVSSMLENKPFTSAEVLVRFIEFAVNHGPLTQLESYGAQLSFIQYFLLDVIFVVLLFVIFAVTAVIFMVKRIFRCLFQSKKEKVL